MKHFKYRSHIFLMFCFLFFTVLLIFPKTVTAALKTSELETIPWNMVTENGMAKALIDWEYAGPLDPLTELARICWLFPQLVDDDLAQLYALPSPEKRAGQRFLPALEKMSFTFVIVILFLIR